MPTTKETSSPAKEELEAFWSQRWETINHYNQKAEWIKDKMEAATAL